MVYVENPITETRAWFVRGIEDLRQQLVDETYEDNGVLRWKSNSRPVPKWTFKEAFCTPSAHHLEVEAKETQESLAAYRKAQADHVPDAEEMYEMRAAFGTGRTVVNILTGRKTRL